MKVVQLAEKMGPLAISVDFREYWSKIMKKMALFGAAAAALVATPLIAMAVTDASGLTRAEARAKVGEHLARFDANKDGFVTREEGQMVGETMRKEHRSAAFAMLDADKNGAISPVEFDAVHARGMRGHGWRGHHDGRGRHGSRGGLLFEALDADKDGRVSRAEADTGALTRFDRADVNKDGTVTREERRAARHALRV